MYRLDKQYDIKKIKSEYHELVKKVGWTPGLPITLMQSLCKLMVLKITIYIMKLINSISDTGTIMM